MMIDRNPPFTIALTVKPLMLYTATLFRASIERGVIYFECLSATFMAP